MTPATIRRRLREELRQLQREIDITTIIVTHDPDEAALLGEEILVLDHGRVLQAGKCEAVFVRPANETVARLLGAQNVNFGIALEKDQIEIGGGVRITIEGSLLVPGERVGWSVRPEEIRLGENGRYKATIGEIASFGAMLQVVVQLGDVQLTVLAQRSPDLNIGPCHLNIDPRSIQVWKA